MTSYDPESWKVSQITSGVMVTEDKNGYLIAICAYGTAEVRTISIHSEDGKLIWQQMLAPYMTSWNEWWVADPIKGTVTVQDTPCSAPLSAIAVLREPPLAQVLIHAASNARKSMESI